MGEFFIDDTNEVLNKAYTNENYKIINTGFHTGRCIIFFSGNGIYYPDNYETFDSLINKKDRFEWENISKSRKIYENFERIIFFRDIFKCWYVKGINNKNDSVSKLVLLCKELVKGYNEVVTCGNSAGGYIATIVGNALSATKIYNFGGQWNIESSINRDFMKRLFNEKENSRNLDISSLKGMNNVYWFYSAFCLDDKKQREYIINNHEIKVFAMNTRIHGDLVFPECYEELLTADNFFLEKLNQKYKDKIINKRGLCKNFMPLKDCIGVWKRDIIHHHKSLQKLEKIINIVLGE